MPYRLRRQPVDGFGLKAVGPLHYVGATPTFKCENRERAPTYRKRPTRLGAPPGSLGGLGPLVRALLRRCSPVVGRFFLASLLPLSRQLVALSRGVACRSCGDTVVGGFTLIREHCLTPKQKPIDSMSRGSMRPAIGRKQPSKRRQTTAEQLWCFVGIHVFGRLLLRHFWRILRFFPQSRRPTPRGLRVRISVKWGVRGIRLTRFDSRLRLGRFTKTAGRRWSVPGHGPNLLEKGSNNGILSRCGFSRKPNSGRPSDG